ESIPDQLSESNAQAESNLPPLCGPGASVVKYVKKLEEVEEQLSEFYNGTNNRFKKHDWDKTRAKKQSTRPLQRVFLVFLGKKLDPMNPVLIGVGLGQFKSTGRLSSLHSTFLDYFIPLARSLGYIVVGLNEYYTSKKCPDCQNFVAQVTLRELYCPGCERYHHRDVMAAENMSRIVRGYLAEQKRPRYLQPKMADGQYPWEKDTNMTALSSSSSTIGASNTSSGGGSALPRGRKRTSSNKPRELRKKAKEF
ncbi:hypothetical protein DFQ29_003108, partial [Apophysomyces sp. BC1021]